MHTLNAKDDFDAPEQLEFTVASGPRHGTFELRGNTFTYVPEASFFGVDAVSITVRPPSLQQLSSLSRWFRHCL